jgi:hypothetical protein
LLFLSIKKKKKFRTSHSHFSGQSNTSLLKLLSHDSNVSNNTLLQLFSPGRLIRPFRPAGTWRHLFFLWGIYPLNNFRQDVNPVNSAWNKLKRT